MEFVTSNACITGGVEVAYKFIYQVEKAVFPGVVVLAVEPVYHIASYQIIVVYFLVVSGSGLFHLLTGKQNGQVFF